MSAVPARPNVVKIILAGLANFFQSIRFRLTLWTMAVLTVILIVFSIFVYTRQAYDLQAHAQAQLQIKAQQLTGIYRMAMSGGGDSDHPQSTGLGVQNGIVLPEYQALCVVQPDGTVLQKVGPVDEAVVQRLVQSWQTSAISPVPVTFNVWQTAEAEHTNQTQYIYVVAPILVERRLGGMIVIGQPSDPDGQLPRLVLTLLLGSLATLAVAAAGGYWVASRAMSPVRTITRTARELGETDLHRRLKFKSHDELGELADTFDGMLDRLQAAFDRQRQFTADASHELRTPLTIVSIEADQVLSKRRSAEEYERAMRVIKSENEFMSHLVNDLLTLARMDAGQTRLRLEALDLSDLALDAAERLTSLARVRGVEITLGELPEAFVQGDRQFLSQALANLVENAIKYAGGRGKHVRIETGSREDPRSGVRFAWISVGDDGPGIPAEHLPHLFDRFYRVDKARSRSQDEPDSEDEDKPDGSGLGLSIVQWIARAHHGNISVDSVVDEGTTFTIELPWAK